MSAGLTSKIQGRAFLRNEDMPATSTSGCLELHQISRLFSAALGIQRNLSSSGLELPAALSRGFPVRSIQPPVPSAWTNRRPPKWSSITTHAASQDPVGLAFDTVKVSDDISREAPRKSGFACRWGEEKQEFVPSVPTDYGYVA